MRFDISEQFKMFKKKEQQTADQEKSKIASRELSPEEVEAIILRLEKEGKIENVLSKLKSKLKNREISSEAIKAIIKLTLKLGHKLGEYDTILSDDVSGRLPSLMFRKIIEHERSLLNKPPVRTLFLSGGTAIYKTQDAISSFVGDRQEAVGGLGKTLLVTEYIERGRSMEKLAKVLEGENVDFDIAAISIIHDKEHYDEKWTKRLYFGEEESSAGLQFYGMRSSAGVEKQRYLEVPVEGFYANPHKLEPRDTKAMESSRADMNLIAGELIDLLDETYKER